MVWNAPELHLLVNHLSVFAAPIALGIFVAGWVIRDRSVENTGLAVFLFSAIGAFASDETGEAAAKFVKALPDFQRNLIHQHAEAADWAVVMCYAAGALALLLLWMSWTGRQRFVNAIKGVLTVVALLAIAALARTAHLGGLIRHSEVRAITTSASMPVAPGEPAQER
jgi:hypothetical protein